MNELTKSFKYFRAASYTGTWKYCVFPQKDLDLFDFPALIIHPPSTPLLFFLYCLLVRRI